MTPNYNKGQPLVLTIDFVTAMGVTTIPEAIQVTDADGANVTFYANTGRSVIFCTGFEPRLTQVRIGDYIFANDELRKVIGFDADGSTITLEGTGFTADVGSPTATENLMVVRSGYYVAVSPTVPAGSGDVTFTDVLGEEIVITEDDAAFSYGNPNGLEPIMVSGSPGSSVKLILQR